MFYGTWFTPRCYSYLIPEYILFESIQVFDFFAVSTHLLARRSFFPCYSKAGTAPTTIFVELLERLKYIAMLTHLARGRVRGYNIQG